MDKREQKQQNERAYAGIREATALYVAQLRSEGLPEAEIRWRVEGANVEVARKMGILSSGEDVPTELYQAISEMVKDVIERGA